MQEQPLLSLFLTRSAYFKPVTVPKRNRGDGAGLIEVDQFSMNELNRQNLVYLKRIVSIASDVSSQHAFQTIRTKVRPAAHRRVKKDLRQPLR